MNEFALIDAYFKRLSDNTGALPHSENVFRPQADLGIGDDCALVSVPAGMQLAVSADTLVCGVHFPESTSPFDIGYKALAVNLSDLAAMGATPAWFTLCVTLQDQSEQWVEAFCDGMASLTRIHPILLIGGDTTRGPLSVSVQVMGLIPVGEALTRAGAQDGDDIYVSGCIGEAALGLARVLKASENQSSSQYDPMLDRLNRPTPRVALGLALRSVAHACIDVSDGLLADLNHILHSSGVGARLDLDAIPVADGASTMQSITAGDDYELCFTAPAHRRDTVNELARALSLPITRIGVVTAQPGMVDQNNHPLTPTGYTHF